VARERQAVEDNTVIHRQRLPHVLGRWGAVVGHEPIARGRLLSSEASERVVVVMRPVVASADLNHLCDQTDDGATYACVACLTRTGGGGVKNGLASAFAQAGWGRTSARALMASMATDMMWRLSDASR
jgi:hypothetical protein